MLTGAHVVLYSTDAAADRAFFRDVLGYAYVDAGHDWLIFALPPAELAVHPAQTGDNAELFLMCEDVSAFRDEMSRLAIATTDPQAERWGLITRVSLPGGGTLGVYEPTHPSPLTPE